jgi:glycosyltransferase involved in cell wall biosynthesis
MATNFVGGPEKQILNHALSVDRESLEIVIGSFSEGKPVNPLIDEVQSNRLAIFLIHSRSSFNPAQIFRLKKFLKNQQIDLLCTHGYKANFLSFWSVWGTGIPQIAFVRGWTGEDWKVKLYDWLDRFWIRFADRIVCVSEAKKNELIKLRVPAEKIEVIYNAYSPQRVKLNPGFNLRAQLKLPADSKIVAGFGRLSPEKGQKYLILAAKQIVEQGHQIKFLIFGEGKDRRFLEKLVGESNLQGTVFLAGFVGNIFDYMNQVDLIVNPSLTEGLPNVILEALALKKPVVATAVGGTPEIIEDQKTGYLVPPADPAALADKILYALQHSEESRKMAWAGFNLLQTKFSLEIQTQKLQNLYRQVVRK